MTIGRAGDGSANSSTGTHFRPIFGWATAWSFDRLRLWLEEAVVPEYSRDQALAHAAAVAGLAGVWLYQGLVPKLLRADSGEVAMWRGLGFDQRSALRTVRAVGVDGGRDRSRRDRGTGVAETFSLRWRRRCRCSRSAPREPIAGR